MKILALSDQVSTIIHGSSLKKHFRDIDLIVGCGDLPASYLEYVVSVLNVPLVYVPGNHDPDRYIIPGGENVDGRIVEVNGKLIAGLGGSIRYKPKGKHQYTEGEMRLKVSLLIARFMIRTGGRRPLDLLITHSPPSGIHDGGDPAHTGFSAFHPLLKIIKPDFMLHGHMHILPNIHRTETICYSSIIMNVFPYRRVEIPLQA
ncbi:MAG: metallophosphoesterase [Anaerolineales bacterium]|nr:metallophosphoesterase [Anaerolineales bacterium]